ncbi:single-stranded DNA-binding protein (plasmid) [Brachybacterium halotolerans subsp. kimchii]|uniref:single-stranded DNA-binding protein n=1 Tax=Brachybacterium halotolerans TaxID=2795215 RepID=UPI001E5A262F|nr:single-stranded DNA-binding protein [Brachybacterium halotolerans]UEJ84622.1 single-stranded DNA-binding protein [Brachybacterium halotolerans subsp. kimchii]
MSYIVRTGNLARTPELQQGERGSYTYARVLVTDSIKKGDEYVDGATTPYDVAVSGRDAERLVASAERNGNIRIMFAGRYYVSEYTAKDGTTRLQHNVNADEIGVSLRGQDIDVVNKKQPAAE